MTFDLSPSRAPRTAGGCWCEVAKAIACGVVILASLLLALASTAGSAAAQGVPAQIVVTVVPPAGAGPRPTGSVDVSLDDRTIATAPLVPATAPLTAATPLAAAAVALLGHKVTISYSGDSNYEATDGVTVTIPTSDGVTIMARPKDTDPPAIDLTSPGDGVDYEVGERIFAIYSCKDPDDRSAVTTCRGPVASGATIDTATAGSYAFEVTTADALGNTATKTVRFRVGEPAAAGGASPAPTTASSGADAATPPPPASAVPADAAVPAAPATATPAQATQPSPEPPPTSPTESRSSAAALTTGSSAGGPADAPGEPGAAPAASPARYAAYDPRSEPGKVVALFVAGFTLLQLAGGGGLAARSRTGGSAGGGSGAGRQDGAGSSKDDDDASFEYDAVDVQYIGGIAAVAAGDRSRSWRWPGTRAIDRLAIFLSTRLAPRAPLVARLVTDGTAMRAMFGSASQIVPAAGLVLGILAIRDTGGEAIPPAAALTIAIAAISVIDAGAGMVAVLTYFIGVLAHGGLNTNDDLRLLLGLAALWCVVPVLAGAARPLRRVAARAPKEAWDRAADFVIAGLIGAWAVQGIVLALPGLARTQLPIADHADAAALCVLGALLLRFTIETLAAHMYPLRVTVAHAKRLDDPGWLQRLGAAALRTTLFLFFAYIVVGSSWQLWAGTALFVIPQLLSIYEEHLPNSPGLHRVLPKGLVEIVLMLVVSTAVGALLLDVMDEHADDFLANTFVLLSLPGFVLSLLALVGRDGHDPVLGWGKRIGGVGLLAIGVPLALGLIV